MSCKRCPRTKLGPKENTASLNCSRNAAIIQMVAVLVKDPPFPFFCLPFPLTHPTPHPQPPPQRSRHDLQSGNSSLEKSREQAPAHGLILPDKTCNITDSHGLSLLSFIFLLSFNISRNQSSLISLAVVAAQQRTPSSFVCRPPVDTVPLRYPGKEPWTTIRPLLCRLKPLNQSPGEGPWGG